MIILIKIASKNLIYPNLSILRNYQNFLTTMH